MGAPQILGHSCSLTEWLATMLRAVLLSRPKPLQAGAEGQPLQGHSSQAQLSTKVSGPPLPAASTPGHRAESIGSAREIHPLKIQKSQRYQMPSTDPFT